MATMISFLERAAVLALLAAVPAQAQPASGTCDGVGVRGVLSKYRAAIEARDLNGTETLFSGDAQVFESGGSEGNYAQYMAHHLAPELAEFKSFRFKDYLVDVRCEGPVAIATETYRYTIELKTGAPVERKGVQTSVLRKSGSDWQIISVHSSSRKPK